MEDLYANNPSFFLECEASCEDSLILALGGSDTIKHFDIQPIRQSVRFRPEMHAEILLVRVYMKTKEEMVEDQGIREHGEPENVEF